MVFPPRFSHTSTLEVPEDNWVIEQDIVFESEDPSFSGTMQMTWTFQPQGERTLVTIEARNVPEGIRPEDHDAGLNSSIEKLAEFVASE